MTTPPDDGDRDSLRNVRHQFHVYTAGSLRRLQCSVIKFNVRESYDNRTTFFPPVPKL
jgi:hypothetical protein